MATLQGPAGGEWVLTQPIGRGGIYSRCQVCGRLTEHAVWQYFIGSVAHACVCTDCADIDNEEVTHVTTPTAGLTPDHLAEIALALEAAHLDWEQGRATSPDTRDYVLITERIITDRIGPEHLWLGEATREQVADDLYEAQCDGRLNEWAEMAEWLAGAVTVGPEEVA